ncbi:MAG: T9SS type A sorting domain-containing protein [Bacteroidales bacterium]|nr:T9SS type A sorting domain-containing protein [Bacteroidales bacterium]
MTNSNYGTTPPNYTSNPNFDEIFHVIEKRDIVPPVLTVTSPVNDALYTAEKPTLSYTITDDNFKSAWYSIDDGKTKIALNKDGSLPLDLPNGDYTMMIQTEDHFRLTDTKSISFSVNILYVPTVTTEAVTDISETSASAGGNITSDGGADITARGLCWSTNETPTISDNFTNDGTGTGSFTTVMTSLEPNTKYYYRAYATNSVGTGYGPILSFTTQTSDINDLIGNHLLIYPNPADDCVSITLDQEYIADCIVEIYDSSGRLTRSNHFSEGTKLEIDLSGLPAGTYNMIIYKNNKLFSRKIIVY